MAVRGRASRGRDEWMLTREGKPSLDRRVECEQLAGPERVTAASLMRSSSARAAQDEVAQLPPKSPTRHLPGHTSCSIRRNQPDPQTQCHEEASAARAVWQVHAFTLRLGAQLQAELTAERS